MKLQTGECHLQLEVIIITGVIGRMGERTSSMKVMLCISFVFFFHLYGLYVDHKAIKESACSTMT